LSQLYDTIGVGYREQRRPDARIGQAIGAALGDAATVVNVGAGAGSYEPSDRPVVAVEIARTMIDQRAPNAAPAVQASGVGLPFADDSFEASLAILTLHHWSDPAHGLRELARVARRRLVLVTFDPEAKGFWLVSDYFPEIAENDRRSAPSLETLRHVLGDIDVRPLSVPHDCTDGFLGAFWRRPAAYLDPTVRGSISSFAKLSCVETGLDRLRADLDDGTWQRRFGHVLDLDEIDIGYRLVVAEYESQPELLADEAEREEDAT